MHTCDARLWLAGARHTDYGVNLALSDATPLPKALKKHVLQYVCKTEGHLANHKPGSVMFKKKQKRTVMQDKKHRGRILADFLVEVLLGSLFGCVCF